MEKNNPIGIIHHIPFVTLSILFMCGCAAVFPETANVMIYDRRAVINGEVWRLLSCHFFHFNNIHLAYNLLTFGVAGTIIERKGYPHFTSFCFIVSLSIGLALLFFQPSMTLYGGLSGIACGSIIYFALWGLHESKPWRTICSLLIFFISLKIGFEFVNGISLLPYKGDQNYTMVPLSHLIGCIVAGIIFSAGRKSRSGSQAPLKLQPMAQPH